MTKKVLCLDVGNTRVKWGVCALEDVEISQQGVTDQFVQAVNDFERLTPMPVWVSTVAAEDVNEQIRCWFKKNWDQEINVLQSEPEFEGLQNAYVKPEELGVDRWLAMIAARKMFKTNFCVVDAGTATTIDMVDAAGKHKGGLIMPGLTLMMRALSQNAAKIGQTEGNYRILADNTNDAVTSGIMSSWLGGIEKALQALIEQNAECVVVLTGGDARRINLNGIDNVVHKNELVLLGVGWVARNRYA